MGFKCFLSDSGLPEDPSPDNERLEAPTGTIAGFDGLLTGGAYAPDPTIPRSVASFGCSVRPSAPAAGSTSCTVPVRASYPCWSGRVSAGSR